LIDKYTISLGNMLFTVAVLGDYKKLNLKSLIIAEFDISKKTLNIL